MTDINEIAVALAHDLVRMDREGKIDLTRWQHGDALVLAVQKAGKLRVRYAGNAAFQI